MLRVFVQARMTSRRFPGKVLAPLAGEPVIAHVLRRVGRAVAREQITLATSVEASDAPLALYAASLGIPVFRGPLDDVFERFRQCLAEHPCDWFVRVCADSPFLDTGVLQKMVGLTAGSEADLITNVQPRTFPKGQSVEVIRASTFAAIDPSRLDPADREHVTRFYYRHPCDFRIVNITRAEESMPVESLAVDTFDDLVRLERMVVMGPE